MIYKVLYIVLVSCSFIETSPPRKPAPIVDGQPRGILVYDDVEDSVGENLEDLEVNTGSSDNEYEETILDPLAADTSRNPSLKPDVNEESTQNSQNISVTENTQGQNPGSDDIFDKIRKIFFEALDQNARKMKEGVHSMLEAGKNIFNGGKNSPFDWNIFGLFGNEKNSEGSVEFEEFSLR